jgi:FemAB-related protein (PEP-CTERM system-associated)
MSVQVRPLEPRDEQAWDAFVAKHPLSGPFHFLAWKRSLERTFGYRARYLLAESEPGSIAGVFPVCQVRNPVVRNALISLPFAVYAGALADSQETLTALGDAAAQMARDLGVQYLDVRNQWPEQRLGFLPIDRYLTFTQPLSAADLDGLLEQIPKKTRNMVRKAFKSEFEFRPAVTDWRPFEQLLSMTYHRLGTPAFPPKHFGNIVSEFGPRVEVNEVRLEGRLAAANLCFVHLDSCHIYYACTDPAYNNLAVNYFMYAQQILRAKEQGLEIFDFGRTKLGTGTLDFKRHWDTTERPLPYEMLLVKRKTLPDFTPKNSDFSRAIEIWRKIPLPLTRAIGPYLVRLFP